MKSQLIKALTFITGAVIFTSGYSMGDVVSYYFVLDTSVQQYPVTIALPQFSDDQNFISCSSTTKNTPIKLIGDQWGAYSCMPTSTLNLSQGDTYPLTANITITANNQQFTLTNIDFLYDPWNSATYPKYFIIYQQYGALMAKPLFTNKFS